MINSRFLFGILLVMMIAMLVLAVLLSGSARWLSLTAVALLLGFLVGALGHGRRSQSDQELRAQSAESPAVDFTFELLNATVNEMREGLLVIDSEMRVVASNRAATNLFAAIEGSIKASRLTEVTRNPAVYDAFLDGVRGIERAGVKVQTHGPARRVFDLRVIPLKLASHGANGAVGVFFDVTRLEHLELVRQEFLSNVSHELRTPLTAIVALAETLEAGAIDDHENNRRFLSIIQKNAARMHRLIDDILELSAIEAGTVKVIPETVQLRVLVDDVINGLASAAGARNVALRNLVAPETEVFADPYRLMQMLTNLIENGIKFNRHGATVSIKHAAGDRDWISVADTGEGIPAHHLERLFERFYRVDRARSRELGGTGLGLAIVKHLAKSHGGEVTVSSKLGEGTQFTIELPRQPIKIDSDVLSTVNAEP